jgi:hypothetical protein
MTDAVIYYNDEDDMIQSVELLERLSELSHARRVQETIIILRQQKYGNNYLNTLNSINNKAIQLKNSGNYEEAKVLFDRCLLGYEKAQGPHHTDTY